MLLLCGCDRDGRYFGNTAPPSHESLVVDNLEEPTSLDPVLAYTNTDINMADCLFEGLVQRGPVTGSPMAALATHYEVSADGMQYTFYLRGHPHPRGIRLPNSDSLPSEYSHGIHAPPNSIP